MNTLRETAQEFALNQWLADYPADMAYDDILNVLRKAEHEGSDDITLWWLVENNSGRAVAQMIDNTRAAFERHAADLLATA
jgi:hypothetical protein